MDAWNVEYAKDKASIATLHTRDKACIATAHEKEVETLEAMHELDKVNIVMELETMKAALAKAEEV